jgi:hypothetical protein
MRSLEKLVVGLAFVLNVGVLILCVGTLVTGDYISHCTQDESLLGANVFLLCYALTNAAAAYLAGRRYL